jgi:LCP family protein required for cell wall assembly
MGEYRVYRVGEDEHVREVTAAAPPLRARAAPPGRSRGARAAGVLAAAPARWRVWAPAAAAVAGAALLYWFFGREAVSNSRAALDIARLSGRVPGWLVPAAPAAAAAVIALVTAYLAFGRRLSLKITGVVAVTLVLAAPGAVVGYANGLAAGFGGGATGDATAPREQQRIAAADQQVDRPLPHKAMNILLIGSDRSTTPGDPGRSDTQLLVRLDPDTKSISMLSLPRDLRVYIDGVGYDKMNAAYSYGGPALVIETFKQITGLPINGWIEVDFAGFWHVTNILGGVYLPIDHRYFVPASADYKSIDLQPGYQLVRGKQGLNFVRFRHDQKGDFTRMQRQQLFIRELQHQSGRWSHDWGKVLKLIAAISKETESSFNSLKKLAPLVELAFQVDTSKVYQAHLEGATPLIDGVSYVEATPQEIAAVVHQFTDPTAAPVSVAGEKVGKRQFAVHVYNGSGIDGLAASAAAQLRAQGYDAEAVADAYQFPGTTTVIYAPKDLQSHADALAALLTPASVEIVKRAPGTTDGITVFVASSFDGTIDVPQAVAPGAQQQPLQQNVKADWAIWQQYDAKTPLTLEAPTAWSPDFTYDQWRDYSIETMDGKRSAASVAVVRTAEGGYWCIQAMRWQDPPEVKDPTSTKTVDGRKLMLFYRGDHLHLVAWRENGALYWVVNTLDDQLSNDLMMGLAASCRPVK